MEYLTVKKVAEALGFKYQLGRWYHPKYKGYWCNDVAHVSEGPQPANALIGLQLLLIDYYHSNQKDEVYEVLEAAGVL